MTSVNFLYHEKQLTWAGVEPATLGAEAEKKRVQHDTVLFTTQRKTAKGTTMLFGMLGCVQWRILVPPRKDSDSIRVEFNKTNAEIKRLYEAKKRASWHEICSKIDARTNNSKLWSIAKSLNRDRPQVEVCNTILTANGFPPNDDRATANILGSHYQKMDLGYSFFLADFSMHELLLVLNALDPKKSPGPDNIHGVMITHLGLRGTQRLLDVFNQSWKSGRLPNEWKRAIIIPIRKPGKVLSSPESYYRSVALTSIPCKIMERMMLRRLAYFLDSNNLLPREQYGFRRGRSTEDQILYFCQCVRGDQNLKPTNNTAAAFLDLSAFDMIWRNKLILKMFDVFGIKGKALPWTSDFF
ncbi:probable RNA-directed DNA polymerase from transposon BS [Trichonephila clavipes]|nr:probable RNA-directed DNA polymerase from transposon BS [Trichonephila clavipes]